MLSPATRVVNVLAIADNRGMRFLRSLTAPAPAALCVAAFACGDGANDGVTTDTGPQATHIGELHAGNYSLGPVAFSGSFWNSCAPYTAALETQAGSLLAGLALKFNGNGVLCDTCILVRTAKGKSVTARVVTTGDTQGPNDIDLSQAAFDAVNSGEYPRAMTWQLVECGAGGTLEYQFQTEANPDWTSLWVRNSRLPLTAVEVKSANHADFAPLMRGTDGTLTDQAGFGGGPFTLRITAEGGQVITDTLPTITPGAVIASTRQFE
jgi:expansin (peptidoglycan-binding protein)